MTVDNVTIAVRLGIAMLSVTLAATVSPLWLLLLLLAVA